MTNAIELASEKTTFKMKKGSNLGVYAKRL